MKAQLYDVVQDDSNPMGAALGKVKDVLLCEVDVPDSKFPPDILTVNGQDAYVFRFKRQDGGETKLVYRKTSAHNVVIHPKDNVQFRTGEVSDEH